jgi:hypothetical protein
MARAFIRCIGLALLAIAGEAAELEVGPGRHFAKPSQAAMAAHDGDTVSIAAGVYADDVCIWRQDRLVLRSIGGLAHMQSSGKTADNKGIWVIDGRDTTVEGIEFSGAASPDRNGAGIRLDGTGMVLRNCFFHDNQNGILTNADPGCDLLIESCEFASNGRGDGQTHNIYVGRIRSLTMRWSYSHHAKVGHNLKTRALMNCIVGSRIMDEATGTSSYVIDVPNGGLTFLLGNLIQQGPRSSNRSVIVSYAEEGAANPNQHLYVCNNTIVNDCTGAGGTSFLNIAATTSLAQVENNIFLGSGTAFSGPVTGKPHNLISGGAGLLMDRAGYDYRLVPGCAAVNAGIALGSAEGQALLPAGQYVHPKGMEPRSVVGPAPDLGAYEFGVAPPRRKEARKKMP